MRPRPIEPETQKSAFARRSRPVGTSRHLVLLLVLLAIAAVQAPPGAQAAKLYWTDSGADKVQRVNTDGTGAELLVVHEQPVGVAVYAVGGKFYWTRPDAGVITRANLDGTGEEVLVSSLESAYGIELDVSGGKMYRVEQSSLWAKFQRANLDGSNVEVALAGLVTPGGLALDVPAGKMYWTEDDTDKIRRANLDGTGIEDVVTSGLDVPRMLELDGSGGGEATARGSICLFR